MHSAGVGWGVKTVMRSPVVLMKEKRGREKGKGRVCLETGLQFSVYIYNTRTEMFVTGISHWYS